MSDIAIRVENLSKRYPSTMLRAGPSAWLLRLRSGQVRAGRIGQREPYKALRDVLPQLITAPFRRLRRSSQSAIRNLISSGLSRTSPSR